MQAAIARELTLPTGYTLVWGGSFANQQRAMGRLTVIVSLTIGLIFVLLYTAFNSVTLAALIIANVPFAMVGGVLALLLTGQYLSVPSAICHRLHRRLRGRDAQRHRACVVHQRPT